MTFEISRSSFGRKSKVHFVLGSCGGKGLEEAGLLEKILHIVGGSDNFN